MNNYDFYFLFYNNIGLFFGIFLIISLVYFLFFKRYVISIIDPLFYAIFFSIWSATVPCFLYALDRISLYYFSSFLLCQFAFLFGFILVSPIKVNRYLSSNSTINFIQLGGQKLRFAKWLFLIIGTLMVTSQLFSYWKYGIPIFAESRLGIYTDATGLGKILKRIIDVIYIPFIVLNIFFISQKQKGVYFSFFTYFFCFFAFMFTILVGSKSSFLIFVFTFFNYSLYSLKWDNTYFFTRIKKYTFKLSLISVIIALIIIVFTEKTENPFSFLIARLAQSGDIFYMSYPNAMIESIPKNENWVINIFGSPLRLLGLISESEIPKSMGFFLMEFHHPEVILKGPNARMNVFSYVFLGYGWSILYCFIIGFLASLIRNYLFKTLNSTIVGLILYCIFVNIALKLEIDFYSSLADFINILLILPPIFLIAYLMSLKIDKNNV